MILQSPTPRKPLPFNKQIPYLHSLISALLLSFAIPLCAQKNQVMVNPANYVNPFVGTGGHGHTFPGAVWPFGMVQLSPDTRIDDSWDGCGGYHYNDSFIYGFSHTHLSGTGVSDYGDVLMMPIGGPRAIMPSFNPYNYRSPFSHSTEVAEPGYYSVYLPQPEVKAELTVTPHVGIHRYTYYQSLEQSKFTAKVLIDLNHRDYLISYRMRSEEHTSELQSH